MVFGIVQPQNDSDPAALTIANYTVDDREPIELPLPSVQHPVPNQAFFQTPQLPSGAHNLVINVISIGPPYTLDHLLLCDRPTLPSFPFTSDTKQTGSNTLAAVIGGILGSMLLVLLIVLGLVLMKLTRKRKGGKSTTSPLRDWLRRR